jgi:hypothetical protein
MKATSHFVARLGGVAAVMGGVLWSAKALHDRNDAPPWPTDATDTLFFMVPLLFLAGFLGLNARSRGRLKGEWRSISSGAFAVGAIGLIGSIVGLLTMALEAGPSWWIGASWMMFVFGLFMGNLGLVFFGTSVLQDGALPRWTGLPIVTGTLGILLILIGDPPNSELGVYPALALWVLYGLAWAGLGCVALAEDKYPVGSAADAS